MNRTADLTKRAPLPLAAAVALVAAVFLTLAVGLANSNALYPLVGAVVVVGGATLTLFYFRSLAVTLVVANLAFLTIANDVIHYITPYALIQDVPLFVLFILGFVYLLRNDAPPQKRFTYLGAPILVILAYFSFVGVLGVSRGFLDRLIFDEWYRIFLYYGYAIPFFYALKEREEYKQIFLAAAVVSAAIAVQVTMKNVNMGAYRFIAFQMGLFPIVLAGLAAWIIKARSGFFVKLSLAGVFAVVMVGLYYTYTRTLWVAGVLALGVMAFLIIHEKKGFGFTKLALYLSILAVPVLLTAGSSGATSPKEQEVAREQETRDVEYRAQSIASPGRDPSFLARVELGYYIYLKIMKRPVFGSGFGDYVRYKIISPDLNRINYPDGSWVYIIWKGGVVGAAIMLWFYWRFFRQSYRVYRRSPSSEARIIALALFSGFAGLMAYSLLFANLNKYKYGSLFALAFAYIEFERVQMKHARDARDDSSS
ncbi:MAG: hypothetical protein GF419_04925 [Ignavibacteriales bacterium]|nr:hypothetical protein [Ignavibacteriales bacterium]